MRLTLRRKEKEPDLDKLTKYSHLTKKQREIMEREEALDKKKKNRGR